MDRAGRVPITNQAPAPRLLRELTGESDGSIPSLLRARASATPDAPYIRWAGAVLTYAETLREAECFAGYLKLIGRTGPEHRVATYLPNCPQALSALPAATTRPTTPPVGDSSAVIAKQRWSRQAPSTSR